MSQKIPALKLFIKTKKTNFWVYDVRTSFPGRYQLQITKKSPIPDKIFPSQRVINEFVDDSHSIHYLWEIYDLNEETRLAFGSSYLPSLKKITKWLAGNIQKKEEYAKKLTPYDFKFSKKSNHWWNYLRGLIGPPQNFIFHIILLVIVSVSIYAIVRHFQ